MNSRDTVKTRSEAVEKRYGKTTKGTATKYKPKKKVSPILGKDKVGIKLKVKF